MSHVRDAGRSDRTLSFHEVYASQSRDNLLNRSFFSKTSVVDPGQGQTDERDDWSPIHEIQTTSFVCDSHYIRITNSQDLADVVRQLGGDFGITHIKPVINHRDEISYDVIFQHLKPSVFNIPLELAAENKEFIIRVVSALTREYVQNFQ